MTSPYLGISYLQQIPFPEKYLKAVLSYIPKKGLKEYLYNANICKQKRNVSKCHLIELIITGEILEFLDNEKHCRRDKGEYDDFPTYYNPNSHHGK